MALTIGELVGYITLDDRGVDDGISHTRREMERLADWMTQLTSDTGDDSGRRLGDAMALTIVATLRAASGMLTAAGRRAGDDIGDGADGALRDGMRDAGRRAGDDLGDSMAGSADDALRAGLGDLSQTARRAGGDAGDDAGDAFGDGLRDGAEDGADEAVDAAEGKLSKLKTGAAAAGALAGAALLQGMTDAMEQDRVLSMMEASMGATPEQMQRYGEAAGELWASAVTEDFQTAADAVAETMNHGLLPTNATMEQIEEMSTGLADVAALLGEEVGPTARAVGKMLKTGLASDGEEALDLLTRGLQLGANEAEDLLDTFSEYSTQFRNMGLSGEEAMGLIVQGLQGGARDADVVADAIKEFSIEAVAGGDRVRAGFESLGMDADEMVAKFSAGGPTAAAALDDVLDKLRDIEDPTERNAVAIELFGTKAEDLGDALYSLDPSSAVEAMGDVGGAAKDAGDTIRDNASTRVEEFKRNLQQNFVNFLGNDVIPALENFNNKLRPFLSALSTAFDQVGGGAENAESRTQGAMSGTAGWVQSSLTQVGEAMGGFTSASKAGWDLWGSDITLIAQSWFGKTKGEITGGLDIATGAFKIAGGLMTGDWGLVWEGIKQMASGAMRQLVSRVTGFGGILWGVMRGMGRGILQIGLMAWNGLLGGVRGVLGDLGNEVRNIKGRILSPLAGARDWLYDAGVNIIQGLIEGFTSKLGYLRDMASNAVSSIRDYLPFSPAKEGPLKSHPPDVAGATIGTMIASGLRGSIPEVAAAAQAAAGAVQVPMRAPVGVGADVNAGAGGLAARMGAQTVRLVVDVRGGDDDIVRLVRGWLADNAGGDVSVLGNGR